MRLALAALAFVVCVAYWAWQERLLRQVRRPQARHRALTEKRTK